MLQEALLKSVSQAIATSLEISIDSVRVIIEEIPESQWAAGGQTLAERRAGKRKSPDSQQLRLHVLATRLGVAEAVTS